MNKKFIFLTIVFILLFIPNPSFAKENFIEIFDVEKNQVVESIPNTEVISEQLTTYLQTLDKVVPNINPLRDAVFLIKVPLRKNVYLNTAIFQGEVNEAILVFPRASEAFILLFDEEQRAMFFYLKLNLADFYLKNLLKISI